MRFFKKKQAYPQHIPIISSRNPWNQYETTGLDSFLNDVSGDETQKTSGTSDKRRIFCSHSRGNSPCCAKAEETAVAEGVQSWDSYEMEKLRKEFRDSPV